MLELSADDDLNLIITIDSFALGGVTAMILYFDVATVWELLVTCPGERSS